MSLLLVLIVARVVLTGAEVVVADVLQALF